MTSEQIAAYNTRKNLAGKPDELIPVINIENGRKDVMTRKALNKSSKFMVFNPLDPPKMINPALTDEVMKTISDKDAEIARLKAALENKEPNGTVAPDPVLANLTEQPAPKKRGRPKKQTVEHAD